MANALGTLSGSLILQRALELVFTERPLLKNITLGLTDLDGQAAAALKNQTVITRIKSLPPVNAFGTGPQDYTENDVPVTLSAENEVHVAFTASEANSTNRDLVNEVAAPMARAIANYFVDQVAALWIAANFPNSTVVAAGWSYTNTLIPIFSALRGRGVPGNLFFAYSGAVQAAILADSMVVSALNNPNNGDAIKTGRLPNVADLGMSPYYSIPATGNMVGFAGSPDSTILAVRPHRNPETLAAGVSFPGYIGEVTEPTTGLTLTATQWIDPSTLKFNTRLSWLMGTAKGNGNNGQILKTA